MANPKVKFKRSSVAGKAPSVDDLPLGEIAVNTNDGRIYTSKSTDSGITTSIVNISGIQLVDETTAIGFANTITFKGSGVNATVQNGVGIVTITSSGGGGSAAGNYLIALTPSFNGVTTSFTMQYDGNNYQPVDEQQLIVSLGGVIQEPKVAYTVDSTTLYFSTAPNIDTDYFIVALNTVSPGTASSTANIPNLSGDVSSNNTVTTLATVNSNVGTYGGTGAIPVVTVNGKGLVTGVSTVALNEGTLQWVTTNAGIHTLSNVGIGTTNPSEKLSVSGKIQIQQDSGSNNRFIFRGQPGSSYRWNIDNYSSSNEFRIFREDDATAANGFAPFSISTTGTLTANKFSGDGSLLTGIVATGSGVVIQDDTSPVGTAATLNFGTNLTATISSGTATISLSNNPSISGILTADQVYTSNNGNGQNVRIGDDFWIGDVNVADTTRFSGAQDSTRAFIIFGSSDAVALGRTGTGPLYYGGNLNVAGVATATSFSGSGTNLTGIVTSITAGTNISINQSTGNVTINATGGGTASAVELLEVMLFT